MSEGENSGEEGKGPRVPRVGMEGCCEPKSRKKLESWSSLFHLPFDASVDVASMWSTRDGTHRRSVEQERLVLPPQRRVAQGLDEELCRILRRQLLAFLLILLFVPIGEIADRFQHDPIDFVIVPGYVKPSPLHFPAYCLALETQKLASVVHVIDEFLPSQDHPRADRRARPLGLCKPDEMIEEPWRSIWARASEHDVILPNSLQFVRSQLLR